MTGAPWSPFESGDPDSPVMIGRHGHPVLLLAFGGLGGSVGIPPFEFFGMTSGLPVDRVFVRDTQRAFYHLGLPGMGGSLPELVGPLRDLVGGAERIVTIGVSAGGYAALTLGPLIGADRIITLNPVATLRPLQRALARDRRWGPDVRRARSGCRDRASLDAANSLPRNPVPEVEVHFAAENRLDRWHAEHLAGPPEVVLHPYPSSTHLMAKEMRDRGDLETLVRRVVSFDDLTGTLRIMSDQTITGGGPLSDTTSGWLYAERPARAAGQLPFWLVAYLVLLPAQVPLPLLARLAPSDVCLLVLAVTSARQIRIRRGVISGWHVALVVSFSIGLLYAALVHNAVTVYGVANKYSGLFLLLLGYIAITWFAPKPETARLVLRRFLQGVVVFTTGTLAVYVVGIAAGTSKPPFSFGGRYVGLLVDPNAQGGLLTLALILFIATRGRPGALLRGRWAMVAIVVLPLALVATGSRSAWLAAALGFLVILISQPAQAARALVIVALPVLMSAVIFGIGVSKLSGDSLNRANTIGQRIEIIDVALDDARQEPVLGGGLGTYFARHGEIVHNTPVWFLADLGVVGLVVFTGLVLWILMQGVVARRWFHADRDLLLGLLIADVAMIGLSVGIEAFAQRHWWLAMALLGSLGATARELQGDPE